MKNELDDLFGPCEKKGMTNKEVEHLLTKEDFLNKFPSKSIESLFVDMYNVLNKKLIISSVKDVDSWEEDIQKRIEDSISLLDNLLENVIEAKKSISIQLKRFLYESKIEDITYGEIIVYMNDWSNEELYNSSENRFRYENYIPPKYKVYQALKHNNRFITILIPSLEFENQLNGVFKHKETSYYYRLDLSAEYKDYQKKQLNS